MAKIFYYGLILCALTLAGCAAVPSPEPWAHRLHGNAIVLLGELHDNAEHHRHRLAVLRQAFAAGWRPAIAMEQFDRERQADMDRARRVRPRDAQHVIDAAAPKGARGGNWNWTFYRPFVELALAYDVPLIAVNLSRADANRIVREGYNSVFDVTAMQALKLDQPIPVDWQSAHELEIEVGHCNALPPKMLPAMARGQLARDAVMASIVHQHAAQGAVLLAGNGHVRRDIGVPRWFGAEWYARTWTVGYLERDKKVSESLSFDAIVNTAPAERTDPCIELTHRMKQQ